MKTKVAEISFFTAAQGWLGNTLAVKYNSSIYVNRGKNQEPFTDTKLPYTQNDFAKGILRELWSRLDEEGIPSTITLRQKVKDSEGGDLFEILLPKKYQNTVETLLLELHKKYASPEDLETEAQKEGQDKPGQLKYPKINPNALKNRRRSGREDNEPLL